MDKHGAGFSTGTERELTCPARGGSGSEPDPRGPAPTGRRYMSESEEVGAHHMADVDCRPWTESASQTGPAPEPDMASTSRTGRELTRPVRGGSGSDPDPRGPEPTGRHDISDLKKRQYLSRSACRAGILNLRNAPEDTLLKEDWTSDSAWSWTCPSSNALDAVTGTGSLSESS